MKTIIGFITLILFTGYTYAQDINHRDVPAVVLNCFQLKFPNATYVNWKLENKNYLVSYEVNNKDNNLLLNDKGKMLKHEQDLYISEIPENVLKTVKSKVAFFDVYDVDKIEEGNKIIYDINFEISHADYNFQISDKGILIKYVQELKESEVPATIVAAIKNKYGSLDIDKATYTEENGSIIYYLEGEINDKDHNFIFTDKAYPLKHEQDLRRNEIPSSVMNTLTTSFSDYEIRDADFTEEGEKTTYDIKLRKHRERVRIILNPDGKILETIKH